MSVALSTDVAHRRNRQKAFRPGAMASATEAAAAEYNFRFGHGGREAGEAASTTAIIISSLERFAWKRGTGNSRICKLPFRIKFIHRILCRSSLRIYSTMCSKQPSTKQCRRNFAGSTARVRCAKKVRCAHRVDA